MKVPATLFDGLLTFGSPPPRRHVIEIDSAEAQIGGYRRPFGVAISAPARMATGAGIPSRRKRPHLDAKSILNVLDGEQRPRPHSKVPGGRRGMEQELRTAIAEFVAPYIEDRYRILNVAAAVEELSVVCPRVDRERIADSLRKYAAPHGVTMLLKPVRQTS